jgi:hypothetical protein
MHFKRKYITVHEIAKVCNAEIFLPLHAKHRSIEILA